MSLTLYMMKNYNVEKVLEASSLVFDVNLIFKNL